MPSAKMFDNNLIKLTLVRRAAKYGQCQTNYPSTINIDNLITYKPHLRTA